MNRRVGDPTSHTPPLPSAPGNPLTLPDKPIIWRPYPLNPSTLRPIRLFTCTLLLTLFTTGSAAVDWPQFLGPTRDGRTTEEGWSAEWGDDGPKLLWRALVDTGYSAPAVVEDRVYTMGFNQDLETVFCLDAKTGKPVWTHTYPSKLHNLYHDGGPTATPLVRDGRVYTVGREAQLFCFEADSGKVIWSTLPLDLFGIECREFGYATSALLEGDHVIIDIGFIASFHKDTGKLIWKSEEFVAGYSSVVAFDFEGRRLGATLNGYGLVVVDLADGKVVDRAEWVTFDQTNCATPIVQGNEIFVSAGYDRGGGLFRLNPGGKLEKIWDKTTMRSHFSNCVLHEGHLYGFDGNVNRDNQGELRCIEWATGDSKWSEPGVIKGSLLYSDGNLVALTEKGELVVAEAVPEEYREISRAQVLGGSCWTMPVLANGRIYCRNTAGSLVCLDVSGKEATP